MKKLRFSSALLLAFIACAGFAQTAPIPPAAPIPPIHDKGESIIIHKNGDNKEKLTIVVDGDNITINGKSAKDFKDGDVQVIRRDRDFVMPAVPPMFPQGGAKAFVRNFNYRDNDAMLGIMPTDADNGAKINEVTEGSAADKAGLKEGDVITKINDTKIEDADDVYDAIGKYKPNDKITITYMRDGKESTATATLDKNKSRAFAWSNNDDAFDVFRNNPAFNFEWNDNKPRLGLRVQDIENSQGVKVMDINDDDSPAAKAGLKEDDIITGVNGKAVQSVKDIKDQLKEIKPGDDVKLQYKRNGTVQSATVHIPKPLQTSDL
ncbi:PDZ domain-containing protein [Ilyomonas limi]|uniref:PDZ domain-containing protein n=1 Tax=Ilyomonas limi TaxID=2575867 RepID=A0A4U3KSJ3_9BACT|nr:PDZ domain-containing protein [Ilyomonas limi]TKK64639.1 PDZ domain-containing protein [Ilyomonas limi]